MNGKELMLLGERIKELRKEHKMTIEDLAKKSGVSTPTICNIENGKRQPRLPVLQKLSVALNCSFEELYELWN